MAKEISIEEFEAALTSILDHLKSGDLDMEGAVDSIEELIDTHDTYDWL